MMRLIIPFLSLFLSFFAIGKPNVVLILSDDMGYSDVGCYGGEIMTPNLDSLAENGLRFSQFYNTARCCPTRASLLSGLYQHQAGIGLMTGDKKLPGYRGEIGRNVLTIAEALGLAGYKNYMSGKWHVTRHVRVEGPKENWPRQRGFDRFYGTIIGAGSFYDPATLCRENTYITPINDPEYKPETYYYTDAISDNAVSFLKDHAKADADKPFFLYLAYTTAHWPMHALPKDIEKYKGKYDCGFDLIRETRLEKLKALGLVSPDTKLSPGSDNWEKTPHKVWERKNMEVYAAMVDNMDQGIGKVMNEVKRQGRFEDTLFLYLQDNGGCAEGYGRYTPKNGYREYKPMGPDDLQKRIWPPMQTRDGRPLRTGPGEMAGPEDTFIGYGRGWANVSNTPFREYKHFAHEGGISTPLIAHWPKGIAKDLRGKIDRQPGHLIDVMATCVDISGLDYPKKSGEHEIDPLEGVSLGPAFRGKPLKRTDALYFEHHLNCAVRDGDWKLVRYGRTGRPSTLQPWELYDMAKDRIESENLAKENPEIAKALEKKWETWATRAKVKPWPWKFEEK
jgi:arylsulfatase A-like enzyme